MSLLVASGATPHERSDMFVMNAKPDLSLARRRSDFWLSSAIAVVVSRSSGRYMKEVKPP